MVTNKINCSFPKGHFTSDEEFKNAMQDKNVPRCNCTTFKVFFDNETQTAVVRCANNISHVLFSYVLSSGQVQADGTVKQLSGDTDGNANDNTNSSTTDSSNTDVNN